MKIEEGKRYVRRDGKVSGKIITRISDAYPFFDPQRVVTYSAIGKTFSGMEIGPDLITEYKEPSMKEIDFKKPLRFMDSTDELNYIGIDSRGFHVVEIVSANCLIQVDRYGKSDSWQDIENIPEKLVMWVNFYKDSAYGYPTREEADNAAGSYRLSCVRVECDEGEGL